MASDGTKVLNTIAKYNYNTLIHTHTKLFFKQSCIIMYSIVIDTLLFICLNFALHIFITETFQVLLKQQHLLFVYGHLIKVCKLCFVSALTANLWLPV